MLEELDMRWGGEEPGPNSEEELVMKERITLEMVSLGAAKIATEPPPPPAPPADRGRYSVVTPSRGRF